MFCLYLPLLLANQSWLIWTVSAILEYPVAVTAIFWMSWSLCFLQFQGIKYVLSYEKGELDNLRLFNSQDKLYRSINCGYKFATNFTSCHFYCAYLLSDVCSKPFIYKHQDYNFQSNGISGQYTGIILFGTEHQQLYFCNVNFWFAV